MSKEKSNDKKYLNYNDTTYEIRIRAKKSTGKK